MRRILSLLTAATLATGLSQLRAADLDGGIHTGLSLPFGDLKDKDQAGTNTPFGAHIGGHLDINFTRNHQLRPHITYHVMPGSRWGGFEDTKVDYKNLQVGADYVLNFDAPNRGAYFLAGASFNQIRAEYDNRFVSGTATQSGRLGVRVGGGYNFNKLFSVEGHLNQVSVDKNGGDGFGFDTATWIQVSAVWRFGH